MTAARRPLPRCVTVFLLAGLYVGCQPGYRSELRAVEAHLLQTDAVACVQSWLAASPEKHSTQPQPPGCLRGLEPRHVRRETECGGVSFTLVRGEVFHVTVCPPGRRPAMSYHVPTYERPGYLGPFGSDAFIFMPES